MGPDFGRNEGEKSRRLYGLCLSGILVIVFHIFVSRLVSLYFAQGFATGDAVKDSYAVRKFVEDGHNLILSQSFAKVPAYVKIFSKIRFLYYVLITELWFIR